MATVSLQAERCGISVSRFRLCLGHFLLGGLSHCLHSPSLGFPDCRMESKLSLTSVGRKSNRNQHL